MPLTQLFIEVPGLGDNSKNLEVEGAIAVGEKVAVSVTGLPADVSRSEKELRLRVLGPMGEDVATHGGWDYDGTKKTHATSLDLASVQAFRLFFPPPPPPRPHLYPRPPAPPMPLPPPGYDPVATAAAMRPPNAVAVRLVLELRGKDGSDSDADLLDSSLLGTATVKLNYWPADWQTATLIDLANGRVYSKEEVDALIAEEARQRGVADATESAARISGDAKTLASSKSYTDEKAQELDSRKADLVGGKVPASQLPSYVDDVLEFDSVSAFPATGDAGKIYVALDTNKTYRWSGSEYVVVGGGDPPVLSVNGKTGAVVLSASDVGAATVADVTLTEASGFTEWVCEPAVAEVFGKEYTLWVTYGAGRWLLRGVAEDGSNLPGGIGTEQPYDPDSTNLTYYVGDAREGVDVSATRTAKTGYQLGSQSNKPLQPAGNYALKSEIPDVPTLPLSVANGGTGATTAAAALANLGALSRAEAEAGFTEWRPASDDPGYSLISVTYDNNRWTIVVLLDGETSPLAYTNNSGPDATAISFSSDVDAIVRTRLPTMADIPILAAPSTDASAHGKAADAKATGDALALKMAASATGVDIIVQPTGQWGGAPIATFAGIITERVNTKADSASIAPAFSKTSTYAVGDYCTYQGQLYKCATAVSTAGEWDAANWSAVAVTDAIRYAYRTAEAQDAIDNIQSGRIDIAEQNAQNALNGVNALDRAVQTISGMIPSAASSSNKLATASDIPSVPVKSVKRNGTALTPDADGAVNVEVPTGTAASMNVPAAAAASASATEVVRGDDPRLSDARTPTAHTHRLDYSTSGIYTDQPEGTMFKANNKGAIVPAVAGTDYLKQHQDISGKLDANKRNLLAYASTTTLALETAVYRSALNADGTFPTITDTGIPTAAAYYQFELELTVPSTVPSTITGPSGWTWLDGHGLPDPADLSGGETICISVRLDCTARTFLASVWRVA